MIMPAGSSKGAAKRRAVISHISTKDAPSSTLVGSRSLASLPNRFRHICGTIRPMKLNSPAKLTINPAIILDKTSRIKRVRFTLSPRERA